MLFHAQKFRMPAFDVDHNARAVALGYLWIASQRPAPL
jgi:hypothetical protein